MFRKLMVLLLVLAMLFAVTGLATAQGRSAGSPLGDDIPGGGRPADTPSGQEQLTPEQGNGKPELEENGALQEDDGVEPLEITETDNNGAETDENGAEEELTSERTPPGREKTLGPPAFVDDVLEQKFTVMEQEKLKIRNRPFESDLPPVIMQGRTLIPVRAVANTLDADVEWDPEEQKVTITRGDTTIELYLGELIYYVNGEAQELDVEAQVISNRTFVPLRFISVALGESVDYDSDTGEVSIGDDEEGTIADDNGADTDGQLDNGEPDEGDNDSDEGAGAEEDEEAAEGEDEEDNEDNEDDDTL